MLDVGTRSEGSALDLGSLSPQVRQQVLDRLLSKDFGVWADTLARVGNCVRPVRLRGTSGRIDATTGEVLSTFSSADQPLGVVHVRCGNRRASECPSCSRLYTADMFHLIRVGVTGGKTVPVSVADHRCCSPPSPRPRSAASLPPVAAILATPPPLPAQRSASLRGRARRRG